MTYPQGEAEIARIDATIEELIKHREICRQKLEQEKLGVGKGMTETLKPCPFCGGEVKLTRVRTGYRTSPTTIIDEWEVRCKKKCCNTLAFQDEIFHSDDGEIVVKKNGAKAAIDFWNGRDS